MIGRTNAVSGGGGVSTLDATATVSDILLGKTAYLADGEKHTGTIPTWDGTLTGNGHLNEYVLKKLSYGNKAIFIANYSSTSNTYGTTIQLEAINNGS